MTSERNPEITHCATAASRRRTLASKASQRAASASAAATMADRLPSPSPPPPPPSLVDEDRSTKSDAKTRPATASAPSSVAAAHAYCSIPLRYHQPRARHYTSFIFYNIGYIIFSHPTRSTYTAHHAFKRGFNSRSYAVTTTPRQLKPIAVYA